MQALRGACLCLARFYRYLPPLPAGRWVRFMRFLSIIASKRGRKIEVFLLNKPPSWRTLRIPLRTLRFRLLMGDWRKKRLVATTYVRMHGRASLPSLHHFITSSLPHFHSPNKPLHKSRTLINKSGINLK